MRLCIASGSISGCDFIIFLLSLRALFLTRAQRGLATARPRAVLQGAIYHKYFPENFRVRNQIVLFSEKIFFWRKILNSALSAVRVRHVPVRAFSSKTTVRLRNWNSTAKLKAPPTHAITCGCLWICWCSERLTLRSSTDRCFKQSSNAWISVPGTSFATLNWWKITQLFWLKFTKSLRGREEWRDFRRSLHRLKPFEAVLLRVLTKNSRARLAVKKHSGRSGQTAFRNENGRDCQIYNKTWKNRHWLGCLSPAVSCLSQSACLKHLISVSRDAAELWLWPALSAE